MRNTSSKALIAHVPPQEINKMPRYIVKIKDKYLEWSTITDSPVSEAYSLGDFKQYYRQQYGKYSYDRLGERLERIERNGTSQRAATCLMDTLSGNRAGPEKTELTLDEIYEQYCTDIVQPEIGPISNERIAMVSCFIGEYSKSDAVSLASVLHGQSSLDIFTSIQKIDLLEETWRLEAHTQKNATKDLLLDKVVSILAWKVLRANDSNSETSLEVTDSTRENTPNFSEKFNKIVSTLADKHNEASPTKKPEQSPVSEPVETRIIGMMFHEKDCNDLSAPVFIDLNKLDRTNPDQSDFYEMLDDAIKKGWNSIDCFDEFGQERGELWTNEAEVQLPCHLEYFFDIFH